VPPLRSRSMATLVTRNMTAIGRTAIIVTATWSNRALAPG
jgi:hypothetical protein